MKLNCDKKSINSVIRMDENKIKKSNKIKWSISELNLGIIHVEYTNKKYEQLKALKCGISAQIVAALIMLNLIKNAGISLLQNT